MNNPLNRDENNLTEKMIKVIKLIPTGMTKKEIADRTGINEHTVDALIRQMYDIFNTNSLQELTRVAIQLGYFTETKNWRT